MVFNEAFNLPPWLRYYSVQVDELSDLFLIDHGSTDFSTAFIDRRINLLRFPRKKYRDIERERSTYISRLITELMSEYRSVIYVDCDEFLVVNPKAGDSLATYSENLNTRGVISAIGFNLLHDYTVEDSLKFGERITSKRSKLFLTSSMFKASLAVNCTEICWHDGFHFSNHPLQFCNLYLFHTKFSDLKQGLKRLRLTRQINDQPRLKQATHQRVSEEQYISWLDQMLHCSPGGHEITIKNKEIKGFIDNLEVKKSVNSINYDQSFQPSHHSLVQ